MKKSDLNGIFAVLLALFVGCCFFSLIGILVSNFFSETNMYTNNSCCFINSLKRKEIIMQISWEIEDGYVCKSRLQHLDLDIDDILGGYDEEEFTEENIDNLVEDVIDYEVDSMIQYDFDSKVSWNFRNYDEVKSEIEKAIRGRIK